MVGALQIKALEESGKFMGYGAVFGNRDSYGDVIVKGAFNSSLKNMKPQDVKMLWQHNAAMPIGVYDEIFEDENGLCVKGRLLVNEVEKASECYALLKAGAISGLSIGYSVNQDGSRMGTDGNNYLTDLKLWEVSVVTFPANPEANVESVKKMSIKDFERFLRDSGFSKSEAVEIASHGFKFRTQREAVEEIDESAELLKALETLNQSIITS
jgi:HK97 family phage prohead protease